MSKIFYEVVYQDEEDIKANRFCFATLELCTKQRNCGCAKTNTMDICSNMYTNTEDITIAEDKVKTLRAQGYARVWIKQTNRGLIETTWGLGKNEANP